ncbi:hypothetical protein SAMN05216188_11377 [Lentzea xinjiangensis]|uniref:Uncharacterized protein n=1 Tax=Lentzea xinjiangensis TaxID=402600 RepID=A0A1H9QJR7_9PSEU|nr:hypothetical protein [Lentzea xinjiangensis]SER60668.1 hypothetical protein SAMN05216188_11377 [Lentzea xinjiangensis]
MNITGNRSKRRIGHNLAVAAGLLALTGAATWIFLHPLMGAADPSTGTRTGNTAGVIACGAALVMLTVGGTFFVRPLLVAPAVALSFTAVWTWLAATSDDSGLWAVGAVLTLIGSVIGTAVVATVTHAVRVRFSRG